MPLQGDRVVRSRLQFLADADQLVEAREAMDALEASMKRTEQQGHDFARFAVRSSRLHAPGGYWRLLALL